MSNFITLAGGQIANVGTQRSWAAGEVDVNRYTTRRNLMATEYRERRKVIYHL